MNFVPRNEYPRVKNNLLSAGVLLLAVTILVSCTDGATRIANQIESDVAAFERSRANKATITHQPIRRWGNGCDDAYRLQVDKVGAIIIWCKDGATGVTTGSHSTSYHARFVDTRQTWIVNKKKSEVVTIELEKRTGGKPQVISVR